MRLSYVLLVAAIIGCGGGGGSNYPTGTSNPPGTGTGTGPGTGPGTGTATGSASVAARATDDGYGTATFSFAPPSVTITKGGTVTWTNEGGATHNVTFSGSGAPANVPNFSSGTVSRTFSSSGTFNYQCTNHSGMTGSVTVQ